VFPVPESACPALDRRKRPAKHILKACPLDSKTRHGPIKESSHGETTRRTGGVLAADAGGLESQRADIRRIQSAAQHQ
jgi:hypothetical protein